MQPQSKSGQARKQTHLEFAATQREEILRMLRSAGPVGVSRAELIFQKHFSQCGTRVFELQQLGYNIRSEQREGQCDGQRYVTYVLLSEPLELNPLRDFSRKKLSGDWYTGTTGKQRPREQEKHDFGPMFERKASR